MQKFAVSLGGGFQRGAAIFLRGAIGACAAILCAAGVVQGQTVPLNDNMTNATVIAGTSGSTSGNNVLATLETGESSSLATPDSGTVTVGNSIWFEWTAPSSGNVTFDTLGSVDFDFNTMDTVLAAYTNSVVNLLNIGTLELCSTNDNASSSTVNSSMTFYATAGQSYYVAIYVNVGNGGHPGNYTLNWSEQYAPVAGTFRMTSPQYEYSQNENNGALDPRGLMRTVQARATITRVGGGDGMVDVGYFFTNTWYTNVLITNIYTTDETIVVTTTNAPTTPIAITNYVSSVLNWSNIYENYTRELNYFYTSERESALYTATNINGIITGQSFTNGLAFVDPPPFPVEGGFTVSNEVSVGSAYVGSTNLQTLSGIPIIPPSILETPVTNSDGTIDTISYSYTWTNIYVTNVVSTYLNNTFPKTGIVAFPNFQLNEDVFISAPAKTSQFLQNPVVFISVYTNYLDAAEDDSIEAPDIQSNRALAVVTFLNNQAVNGTFAGQGLDYSNVINFERSTLRCDKTVNGSGIAYVGVTLQRGNPADNPQWNGSATFNYQIDFANAADDYNSFILEAGSDYARPDIATKYTSSSDFTSVAGSITFPASTYNEQEYIQIPITQDNQVKFDRDLLVQLSGVPQNAAYGYLQNLNLTILYTTPAAGACDVNYNADNVAGTSPPFDANPGANGPVYAIVIQPDGKAVIGGDFTGYNSESSATRSKIARLNTNGQLDTSFNPGTGFDQDVHALALDANTNIIAAGEFNSYQGSLHKRLIRITPSGAADPTFNIGSGANGTIWAVVAQTNGQILIAGDFTTFNGTNRSYIARLNQDGSVDSTFDPVIGPNADIYSMAVQTNGQIVIGGGFTQVDGTNLNYIARLNSDGSLDTTFNPGYGFGANNIVNSVAVQPDGKILLAGLFTQVGNLGGEGLARLNSDGSIDTSFITGSGTSDEVNTMVLNSDGTILIGGWFTSYNQSHRVGFARILPSGMLDTSFLDTSYNQFAGLVNDYYNSSLNGPNPVFALAVQPDGNIIVGGSFSQIGGGTTRTDAHPRQNVARVVGGSTPGPGNVELSLPSYTPNNYSGPFYVEVDRTNGTLGAVSATVAAIRTGTGAGYATYGVDYTYGLATPVWGVSWNGDTWMLQDGLYGTNNNELDINPVADVFQYSNPVNVNIISNNNATASMQLVMTQPKGMDTFFLGGSSSAGSTGFGAVASAEGENIPLEVGLGITAAPLTVVHNNSHDGIFNFSPAYYYVTEGSTSVTLTVTRTGGTDNSVTVKYSTVAGTAIPGTGSGSDYRTATGTLNFPAGVSSATLKVTLNPNPSASSDRVFGVTLSAPGGGAALGTVTSATVEIVNTLFSAGHAEFAFGTEGLNGTVETMTYTTNESTSPLQVTVARLGGTVGQLSVHYATVDGTAKNQVNYLGATNVLTWTNGDTTTRTISIPVLDDGVVTPNLTASIYLYNATVNNTNFAQALGSVLTNATLVVNNTDSNGVVQFTSRGYTVNENAGFSIVPVYRSGGTVGPLTFSYFTTNGSAIAGYNYFTNSGTITLAPGQVSTNIIVGISNQGTAYGTALNFNVVLTAATPGLLGAVSNAQVNISGSQAAYDPPGQPVITYSSSAGFNAPVFALALQSNGRLLAGGDFTAAEGLPRNRIARLNTDGTLDSTFSSYLPGYGANSTVRSIVVQDNGSILIGGLFTNYNSTTYNYIARLNVDGSVDPSFNIGAGADNPVYALASTYVNGSRTTVLGGAFTMINGSSYNCIARLLDNGSVDTSFNPGLGANATVYAVAVQVDGKILIGGDFTSVNGTNLNHLARLNQNGTVDSTFNPGLGPNDSVRTIALQLDGNILIGGLFTNVNGTSLNHIARLTPTGAIDPAFHVGAGASDSVAAIAVQSDTRIVVAGNFKTCSGVTRNRITRLNSDGTVDPTINFGTGADNFVAAVAIESSGNIDLGGGFQNYNGASAPYLAQIYGGSLAGSGSIQFGSASYSVDERGTNALISIFRTGGTSGTNADGSGGIYVNFATSNGSAAAGTNYTTVITNVDFPAGEVMETVSVPVFDDGVVTSNLTVNLTLTNATSPASIGNIPSATLSIINDDSSVSFSAATYTVAKNTPGGAAVIQVNRQGSQAGTTTVNFATGTGTATPGTDYTPVNQTLTFGPGISNLMVNVPINNNGVAEGNRTIALLLSNPAGAYDTSPSNALLTIVDTVNLPGAFAFSATNYTVTEGGGSGTSPVLITVVRTNGSSGIVSVQYSTFDGTAAYGSKYISTNGSLTFGDGVTSQSFYVQAINTTTAEGPEYLYVALSNPTGGASLVQTNATVTILNTNVGIAFAMATNSYTEPYGPSPGTVTLNVVRFNNTNGTTTVGYYTTSDTNVLAINQAVAGTNYVGTNGTIVFNPGDSIKPITITTLYDPLVTPDLYFNVQLTVPTNSTAQLTLPSVATVIDHDVNVGVSFYTPTNSVYKNAGYVPILVYVSNTNEEPLSVNYATGGGSAVPGVDYTTTSGTLNFTNGQIFNYFYVPILPNNLVQSNHTFNVTLSNPSGTGVIYPYGTENVTIVNTNTPYGLSFSTPVVLSGGWGSATVNNSGGSPEPGDPTIAGYTLTAPVWFQWTAPANGEVTLDTIGSMATNGAKLDTVLGVYSGGSLYALNQVAANDDLFPSLPSIQTNDTVQNIFDTNRTIFRGNDYNFPTPFVGPSGLRFNAVAGTTYYFAADSKASEVTVTNPTPPIYTYAETGQGNITLNWAYHSSGVFRFAGENVDQTAIISTNVNPTLLYQCAKTESSHNVAGPFGPAPQTTIHTYYTFDERGLEVTVTRVAGSSGRVSVKYATADGDPSVITNGDLPAIGGVDYTPISGTLIFDDYEMSKTLVVPIIHDNRPRQNRDFVMVLSSPQRDPQESSDVSAPRVDPVFGQVACRILDTDIDPNGPSYTQVINTNGIIPITNNIVSLTPTNAIFNFAQANYRVPHDAGNYWGGTPITIFVNRTGTNTGSVTLNYQVDTSYFNQNAVVGDYITFPLEPGSDYATPPRSNPYQSSIEDGIVIAGQSGTLTSPGGSQGNQSIPISFTIYDVTNTEFNKDFRISVWVPDANGNPVQPGMVAETTLTLLFNDYNPPAGSVDEFYNPDLGSAMAVTNDISSTIPNPGTEPYSDVYSLIVLPTNGVAAGNQSIIAGAFTTYSDGNNTYTVNGIARLNNDGTLDPTFNSGLGVNVFPGGEFIRQALLTTNNQIVVGGDFSSFNGIRRNSLARLNANGSLDTTFNPGVGVNGTVWAMALQPDGRVIIGGDFTSYNGQSANYLARVNTDGTLDTTFNAGTNLNAAVYALALEANGGIVAGGAFTSVGGANGQNRIARLNADGSLDTTFNTITGPNAPVRSLAIQQNGSVLAGGEFTVVAGLNDNYIVRFTPTGAVDSSFNAGIGTDGTVYSISDEVTTNSPGSVTEAIYIGGSFTSFNGTHRLGFARLYADGSLDTTFLDTAYNQFAGLPRIFYNDPPGIVYASGVQADGNIMIGGSFSEVGGGQASADVRDVLDYERGVTESFADTNLYVSWNGYNIEPKTRDGVRIRGNVARLIGGATPGPGNIGLGASSYAANKTQIIDAISLVRTNGSLGYASANFAVQPGLAKSGLDYYYSSAAPLYPIEWEYSIADFGLANRSRYHADALYGQNELMLDNYGNSIKTGLNGWASVDLTILDDTASAGNLDATLGLANPSGADQFYLGGENIPLGVALGESTAPFTLVDNSHQDGVFGFASSSFTATNSIATVTISRTNSSIGSVQLSYQTVAAGSTAVNGVDYLATNGLVLFNSGQTNGTFPITVLQDSSISSTEKTVNLQLYNLQDLSQGNATLGLTNAVLRIINPNFQGYLSLTTNYYIANQTGGSISFTIARTVGSKGTLSVKYATYDVTASNNVNYIGSTNAVTWNNGDVSAKTINIPLIYTNVTGPSVQFGVFIYNPTLNSTNVSSLLGAITNATMNIINNNNYGTFQFSASPYLVNENGGYATITVTRTGSALGSAAVNYSTMDGTARAGVNYYATNGTISFANRQVSQSFNVGIINDGVIDPPPASFYFNVGLSLTNSSAGYSLGSLTNAAVDIVDAQTYNQPPGSIDPSFNPTLAVNGNVLGLAQQSSGQIVAGGLFTSIDGVSLNHVARLNTDGSLDLSFMRGLGGADGSVNQIVVQTDDRILIGGAFANVNGATRNNVARLMTDGTLDTSFAPGSAADNSVFALAETFINGSRELYVGGAFSTFNGVSSPGVIRLNNNGYQDAGFATGSGANGTVYAIAVYPTNTIFDNGDVLVGGSFTNFNNTVVGNLARLNPNGSVDTTFSGTNVLANGTVRAIAIQADGEILIGGDFTSVDGVSANHLARLNADGTLDTTFAANLLAGINGSVDAITVQPDNRIVVAGQFSQASGLNRNDITRLLPNGMVDPTINFGDGANGAVNAVVVQATNDFLLIGGAFTTFEDQPIQHIARLYGGSIVGSGQFSFNSANYQIDETGGFATITVVRTGGSSGPASNPNGDVYVAFSTTNGTAVSGVNYTGVTNELLDFPMGQSFQKINIPVTDDGMVTPNLTVNLGLAIPPGSPAGLGDQASAELTIINDDSGVSFAQANYSVPKNTITGVANIGIIRVGSTSGGGTVNFATGTNGTAVIGVDYYPTNVTVTFNPGDSEEFVQVPIINNTIPEGQRTIGMSITNASGFVLASPTNAILTIIDTVDAPGQLLFATNSYSVVKANTNVILTVLRTNGFSGSVSVNYSTTAGTALPGQNYLTSSGTLTLGDGVPSGTIAIPILDNVVVQGTVNFTVNLFNALGGATLISPTNAVVNIVDHNLGVSFQSATNYTVETAGTANVFVQRIGATNTAFSVNYATYPITALPGTNYTSVSGVLNFAPGQSLEAIAIPVLYDRLVTGDLYFGVSLSNATASAQVTYPSNALVVIHDADAGLSFSNSLTSVYKNQGSLTVAVICSNPSAEPVIVNSNTVPLEVSYFTTNGTAQAGIDYGAVSGTLVFTNGIATNYFTVPIINSGVLAADKTFNIILANPTAPGQVVSPGTNTVTIVNVNSGVEFSSATYTTLKTNVQATITVLRTGYTSNTVSVNYLATNGTAIGNQNFIPVSGTLVFTNGQASQQFSVPIINSSAFQPDLTVTLELSSPVNTTLTYPSFATLTIEDLSGSSVVPAGAVLVRNQVPTNGIPGLIYPGTTNTINFAFRDSSGTNVGNLIATLLSTNGVTPTNGPVTQTYGPLTVGGHSVSRPFSFLASGTNGQQIEATFQLMDGTKNIGTNNFTFYLGTWQSTFSNTAPIIIGAYATASPYPSIINVSGLEGIVLKTTVTLTNLDHTRPADLEVLVVAPNQEDTLLMNNVGAGNAVQNVTLTFDDSVTNKLPQNLPPITTSTNEPTEYPTVNPLP